MSLRARNQKAIAASGYDRRTTGAVGTELQRFLDAHPAHAEFLEDWPLERRATFLVRLCLAPSPPPLEWTSSILGIVTHPDGAVLFSNPTNPTGALAHLLFGGRSKTGEPPEATLRREVAEETGWHAEPEGVIGFRHFRHLGPPHPQLADRPYPEFVQPVYAATAVHYDAASLRPGEQPVDLVDVNSALRVTDAAQRPLLQAAIQSTGLAPVAQPSPRA